MVLHAVKKQKITAAVLLYRSMTAMLWVGPRDGTLVGYTFSKRYKKVSPHRKSHNLLYNLLKEKNKPPQEMVNKRGVPFGPTWLTRTLDHD